MWVYKNNRTQVSDRHKHVLMELKHSASLELDQQLNVDDSTEAEDGGKTSSIQSMIKL